MSETIHILKRTARKHGKAVTWSSIALAIAGLIIQAIAQHNESGNGRQAIWARLAADEQRIEALEKQSAFDQGFKKGENHD